MNVKAQGLLNAARHIEQAYGRDTLGEIVRACSPAVRETFTSSIAINWHPRDELVEFVEVAAKHLRIPPYMLARDVGAAGAWSNMRGTILRIAVYYGRPELIMRRSAGLWRQFNSHGTMELIEMTATLARIEVRNVPDPNPVFCGLIEGWVRALSEAMGVKRLNVSHPECRARNGERCLYEVRGQYDRRSGGDVGGPEDGGA